MGTKYQLLNSYEKGNLISEIDRADIITARTRSSKEQHLLYKRPQEDIEARGFPYDIKQLNFMVDNKKELEALAGAVEQLKYAR